MENLSSSKMLDEVSGGTLYIVKGKINYANPAAEKIFNKTSAEMLNNSFAKIFIDYAENDDFNQIIIDVINDFSRTYENIVPYFDGKNFKFLHMKTSILHNGTEKMGIMILFDDISEILKLCGVELNLTKIKELNAQLESRTK